MKEGKKKKRGERKSEGRSVFQRRGMRLGGGRWEVEEKWQTSGWVCARVWIRIKTGSG
jgi:hypothetical protein